MCDNETTRTTLALIGLASEHGATQTVAAQTRATRPSIVVTLVPMTSIATGSPLQ